AGANTRIMAAVEQAMRTVSFWIVKLSACLAVPAPGLQLTSEQAGRPGSVMSLQARASVSLVLRQGKQLLRKSATEQNAAGTRAALPQTVDGHEAPARFAMLLRQLARPGVSG